GDALDEHNMNFDPGILNDASEFTIGEFLAAGPIIFPAHGIVQEAIPGECRPPGMNHSYARRRRRHGALLVDQHLEVINSDFHLRFASFNEDAAALGNSLLANFLANASGSYARIYTAILVADRGFLPVQLSSGRRKATGVRNIRSSRR